MGSVAGPLLPDVVTRFFHMKLTLLIDNFTKTHCLGKVVSWVYTIEFQKMGLPHAHIILILSKASVLRTPFDIDRLVTAEIPNPNKEPELH